MSFTGHGCHRFARAIGANTSPNPQREGDDDEMSIIIPNETGLQNDESLQIEDGSLSLSTYAGVPGHPGGGYGWPLSGRQLADCETSARR